MIVSFTIFVTFLIFMFIYINPVRAPTAMSTSTALENSIALKTSVTLEVTPFATNQTLVSISGKGCFQIENPSGSNIFVTDKDWRNVDFTISGENLLIKNTNSKFYYIYSSNFAGKQATPPLADCLPLTKDVSYSLSLARDEKMHSYRRFEEMNSSYYRDYAQLKKELNHPPGSDFAAIVFDQNGNELFSMTRFMPNVNIMSKEYPIDILDDRTPSIGIIKGYIRILSW